MGVGSGKVRFTLQNKCCWMLAAIEAGWADGIYHAACQGWTSIPLLHPRQRDIILSHIPCGSPFGVHLPLTSSDSVLCADKIFHTWHGILFKHRLIYWFICLFRKSTTWSNWVYLVSLCQLYFSSPHLPDSIGCRIQFISCALFQYSKSECQNTLWFSM